MGLFGLIAALSAAAAFGGPVAVAPGGARAIALGDLPAVSLDGRRVDLGNNGPVDALAWLDGGRLAVVTGRDAILHVLEPDGRRSARWELHGRALALAGAGPAAVVLVAPPDRAGAARLVLVAAGADPHELRLPGIRAGGPVREGDPTPPWTPGLAVGRDGRIVVAGARRYALVTAAGAVRLRPLRGVRSERVRTLRRRADGRVVLLAHARRNGAPVRRTLDP